MTDAPATVRDQLNEAARLLGLDVTVNNTEGPGEQALAARLIYELARRGVTGRWDVEEPEVHPWHKHG